MFTVNFIIINNTFNNNVIITNNAQFVQPNKEVPNIGRFLQLISNRKMSVVLDIHSYCSIDIEYVVQVFMSG